MVDIELVLDTYENTIPKDFYLDKRITSAMPPLTNIKDGAREEYPYYLKPYRIDDEEIPEPKKNKPLYNFAEFMDERINDGTIDTQSGVGFLIESLKFNFNTLIFWGGMPAPHVPYPYAFMYQDDEWVEVEPKKEGLKCLYESDIFLSEDYLRRELIDSKKERSDWKKYLTDTKIRSIL